MGDHDDAKLLRAALEHWVATRDALLGVYALPLTADEHQRPGVEYVREWLLDHAPCGNGPLERAIRRRLREGGGDE